MIKSQYFKMLKRSNSLPHIEKLSSKIENDGEDDDNDDVEASTDDFRIKSLVNRQNRASTSNSATAATATVSSSSSSSTTDKGYEPISLLNEPLVSFPSQVKENNKDRYSPSKMAYAITQCVSETAQIGLFVLIVALWLPAILLFWIGHEEVHFRAGAIIATLASFLTLAYIRLYVDGWLIVAIIKGILLNRIPWKPILYLVFSISFSIFIGFYLYP